MQFTDYLNEDWKQLLRTEFEQEYFKTLETYLTDEYAHHTVYPQPELIFNALNLTPYKAVKVVILGQDPYHGEHQAHGLSFSVLPGVKIPPSLLNIYKELQSDLKCTIPDHGFLESWAKQGVLLLNTVLTVKASKANAHQGKGWETLTDKIISLLNQREESVIFMLWGKPSQSKIKLITNPWHLILTSSHPSPLSSYRGFLGCGHFSTANDYLKKQGFSAIDWQIKPL